MKGRKEKNKDTQKERKKEEQKKAGKKQIYRKGQRREFALIRYPLQRWMNMEWLSQSLQLSPWRKWNAVHVQSAFLHRNLNTIGDCTMPKVKHWT